MYMCMFVQRWIGRKHIKNSNLSQPKTWQKRRFSVFYIAAIIRDYLHFHDSPTGQSDLQPFIHFPMYICKERFQGSIISQDVCFVSARVGVDKDVANLFIFVRVLCVRVCVLWSCVCLCVVYTHFFCAQPQTQTNTYKQRKTKRKRARGRDTGGRMELERERPIKREGREVIGSRKVKERN